MKIKQRIVALMMTTVLISSNLLPIGSKVIAAGISLDEQNSKTNHANVEFNSYLGQNAHTASFNVTENGAIYLELKVKENGYLKNGIVEFSDVNYEIVSDQIKLDTVQKVEDGKIYLKQINAKEQAKIEIPIKFANKESMSADTFSKVSTISFKATYVDGNGKERTIEKEIVNEISWKNEAQVDIKAKVTKFIPYHVGKEDGEEYGVLMQAQIMSGIKDNILPVKNTNLEISSPEINGIKPEKVTVLSSNTKNTSYKYDKEKGLITINTSNLPNEKGEVSWQKTKEEYLINYVYTGKEIYSNTQAMLEYLKEIKAQYETSTNKEALQKEKEQTELKGNIEVTANIEVYSGESKTANLKRGCSIYHRRRGRKFNRI